MPIIIKSIISVVIAYLLGSILPAYLFGRLKGFDIRKVGTGNPGTSNAGETMGYGIGAIVAIYDLGKPVLAIFIARWLGTPVYISLLCGFVAIAGHLAPFYLRFKGGRGGATSVGIIMYSLTILMIQDWRFVYYLVPLAIITGILFFFRKKIKYGEEANSLLVLALVLIFVVLFYGINPFSIALLAAGLFKLGEKIHSLLMAKLKELPAEEKPLLKRKWLRPFAVVFPIGVLIDKRITLYVLGAVLLAFVVFEILRFATRMKWFPIKYRAKEKTRLSSMVMYLFSVFLTLLIFPPYIASLAVMFVTFGDLLAWAVGYSLGGKGFLGKTYVGTSAFFVTTVLISSIYYKLGMGALGVGIAGGAMASLVEAAPIEEDNFVIPIASAIVMSLVSRYVM
ncbi:glycerol-3-phosphate acyltransferase [bacterium]|nr:glycerol-3-phosphate acyltransferase [bacterium]